MCASNIKQDKERAVTWSELCTLCASKRKWDTERVGTWLEVCALYASEIKQDKEKAAMGSREVRQREGRNGVGSVCLARL